MIYQVRELKRPALVDNNITKYLSIFYFRRIKKSIRFDGDFISGG